MQLSNIEKNKLNSCLKSSNNFIILTTGRAGTDFLQSCFDDHDQVATTSEKNACLVSFLEKRKNLLPHSSYLFSALIVEELLCSFAPYLNQIEDWRICENDEYRRSDIKLFLNSLSYLLTIRENYENPLAIARSIILSFSYSIGKDIDKIKTILIHLHHINQLPYYSKYLTSKDLVLVCSRNPYDLVASGVFHWRKYWRSLNSYAECNNISHYRNVLQRTLFDFVDIKNNKGDGKPKIFLSMLEKLSNISYLNYINHILSIEPFKKYPSSTVLGFARRGDLLSSDNRSLPLGTFDPLLVQRGSPFDRLGIVDSILITLICKERIQAYDLMVGNKFLDKINKLNIYFRIILLFIFIPIPTKIEIMYYLESFSNILKIIFYRKSSIKNRIKNTLIAISFILLYPIEYLRSRFFRIKAFLIYVSSPKILTELKF